MQVALPGGQQHELADADFQNVTGVMVFEPGERSKVRSPLQKRVFSIWLYFVFSFHIDVGTGYQRLRLEQCVRVCVCACVRACVCTHAFTCHPVCEHIFN